MYIYWIELKRFLVEKKKVIIGATLLFSLLFSSYLIYSGQKDSEEQIKINEANEIFEKESKPSFFRFYIENTDGSSFRNEVMIKEIFNMENLYGEVLLETSININKIRDLAEEKEYFDFEPIKIKIDGDSNIYTALFETGDNKDNIILAEYYYDYLLNNHFTVLENHKIYSLSEPKLLDLEEDIENNKSTPTKIDMIKEVIINIVKGFIIALGLSLGLLIFKELFSKKLNYIFGYNSEDFDDSIVYDKNLDNEKSVQYFLSIPSNAKKLILIEDYFNKSNENILFSKLNTNVQMAGSMEDSPISGVYDEIIVIIKAGKTTRKWYNKQTDLLKLHGAKNKVVQLNNEISS